MTGSDLDVAMIQLERFNGLQPRSQDHNLVLIVLRVPTLLDSSRLYVTDSNLDTRADMTGSDLGTTSSNLDARQDVTGSSLDTLRDVTGSDVVKGKHATSLTKWVRKARMDPPKHAGTPLRADFFLEFSF